MLIKMNRKHDMQKYRQIIESIRFHMPSATIFTDIIVGFTEETEEQFENTRKAMEEFKFNMAYVARYSPRPGAASSRWQDDIPQNLKRERLQILTDELMKHSKIYNEQQLLNKEHTVLVIGKEKKTGYLTGLTEGKIIVRILDKANESLVGQFVQVKITAVTELSTQGKLVHQEAPVEL